MPVIRMDFLWQLGVSCYNYLEVLDAKPWSVYGFSCSSHVSTFFGRIRNHSYILGPTLQQIIMMEFSGIPTSTTRWIVLGVGIVKYRLALEPRASVLQVLKQITVIFPLRVFRVLSASCVIVHAADLRTGASHD